MAKKRVTRKKLLKEPDEFITTTGKMIRLAQRYQTQISYGFGAIVVVLAIITGLYYYNAAKTNTAFSLLDQALAKYEARKNDVGEKQAYLDVQSDFEPLLNKYSGTDGGKIARIAFADICYGGADYANAVSHYQQALKNFAEDPFFQKMINNSLGHASEKKNDTEAAIRFFETVEASTGTYLKDEALFHLGLLNGIKGNSDKRRAAFEKIRAEYPTSMYINMVSEAFSG